MARVEGKKSSFKSFENYYKLHPEKLKGKSTSEAFMAMRREAERRGSRGTKNAAIRSAAQNRLEMQDVTQKGKQGGKSTPSDRALKAINAVPGKLHGRLNRNLPILSKEFKSDVSSVKNKLKTDSQRANEARKRSAAQQRIRMQSGSKS